MMTAWGAFPGHIGVRQVMLERASALSQSGRWGAAAGLLRAAIDEHADVSLAAMLGGVLVQLDRHEDAIVLLRAARVADPDNVSLLLNLATALVHAAEDADALAVLGRARDVVGAERLPPLHATALALLEQRNGADVLARSALESMDPEEAWANSLRRLLEML